MKRKDLEKKLKKLGWTLSRHRRKMMRLAGRVFKSGKHWAIEVPILGLTTQGHSKKDAFCMISDALESLVNKNDFKVDVYPGKNSYFEISSKDVATLTAFLLRRQRLKHGLTLVEVTKRLGAKSHNTYARYEQGRSVPTIEKLTLLLSVLSENNDFVLIESQMVG
ncbi:MAG: helix-turn-helix domain-containing protein [Candidatus Aminicenantes bacterium]|nr:helix-turn-helix domain-containing protein [Candidatus Aminicenantes bacterium]